MKIIKNLSDFILEQNGLKSDKKALKRYILATLKITPKYKQFLGKIDGGPISTISKNVGQKAVLIGPLKTIIYSL